MDDWATSSPWAETTNDDDDFADFQSSVPAISKGQKGVTTTNGGEVGLGGGVVNGFTPFKENKETFTNGWGFDDHDASHTQHADIRGGDGWKVEGTGSGANRNGNGNGIAVIHPPDHDEDRLKPGGANWTYKNEWAKSEESLAPSDASNVWNKPDDWGKPETNPPESEGRRIQEEDNAETFNIEAQPAPGAGTPSPVARATEPKEEPTEEPMEKRTEVPAEAQTDGATREGQVDPDTQGTEKPSPPVPVEPEKLSLTVPETVPSRSTSPISMGSDFGDFEAEDTTTSIDVEAPVSSVPVPAPFDIRNIDIDNFAIGNLGALDALYKPNSLKLPTSDISGIISTTSQRKAWYKLIRKESARNSIQGEDVLRVRWTGSETQKKVHEIVKRWISEDRIGGRTMLGRNASGAGMFDWNSTSPRSSAMSPTKPGFQPPKSRFEPAKRMSMGVTSLTSPRSPSFGWSSAQSPQNQTFGWSSGSPSTNSKASAASPKLASPPGVSSPVGNSSFPPISSPRQTTAPKHTASSSVDIPRPKQTPSTNRPMSMFIGPGPKSLFGELSIAEMGAPPARASVSLKAAHTYPPSMGLSVFESSPPKPTEAPADTSFDDDFGDFEGPELQAAPPPPRAAPQLIHTAPSYVQAAPQIPQVAPPTFAALGSTIPSNPTSQPHHVSAPAQPIKIISEPPARSSLDIATKSNEFDLIMAKTSKATAPAASTILAQQAATDPWGSFDIFDAPKQAQSAPQPAPARTPKTPMGRPSLPPLSSKSSGKVPVKQPALPILSPPIITRTNNESAIADDDFDDWGEMVSTPSTDKKAVEWPASQTPKLSVSAEPPPTVRRRSWTLDMFGAPSEENITSANPQDILPTPKPPSTKRIPSPISIQKVNNMPIIPGTPSPGAASLFSPNTLVPSRVSTPTIATHPPPVKDSPEGAYQNSSMTRNGSISSISSMNSLSVKKDETGNKRYSTPIFPTQQFVQPAPPRPTASPQPNISSPLASEWGDMDFGAFEDATPKAAETKPPSVKGLGVKGMGHRPTASMGNIGAQLPPTGISKHVSRGSVTMSPIVGKKDEDSVFNEIINLLPDMSYMLK
ncbi:hypothetical protein TWF594_000082 [Orbilia oligospora]|uniref:Uncharacterized protein n=1 Tax=Orbilia oligospora TaxID=2813651 RepID=A0A7C8JSG7_ORBOL|nr:hypothetical protein TWF703_004590 [Orbilia oligospora]KAF3153036.1 hypothetical protein TWF594_000082 [Orbilia oligospora]